MKTEKKPEIKRYRIIIEVEVKKLQDMADKDSTHEFTSDTQTIIENEFEWLKQSGINLEEIKEDL